MSKSLAVCLVAGALLLGACGREGASTEAAPTQAADADSAGSATLSGSCVDQYSLDALKTRDYAFDGTVKTIEPSAADDLDRVVFEVQRWFKGGSGAEATRQSYGVGAVTSVSTSGLQLAVGQRMLVAGDDDFIWECGYTQPYEAGVAAEWERTLGR